MLNSVSRLTVVSRKPGEHEASTLNLSKFIAQPNVFLQYDVTITNEIFQNVKHLNSKHTIFFPLLNRTLKL